jgi:hypothetical protein
MSAYTYSYKASVQKFTVKTTGMYEISTYGAQGGASTGNYAGGYGAEMVGDFSLTAGETIDIVVGGEGKASDNGGGGGGGSFVMLNGKALIIAGGGGGSAAGFGGAPGQVGPSGSQGYGSGSGAGGAGGQGGSGASAVNLGGGGGYAGGYGGSSFAPPTGGVGRGFGYSGGQSRAVGGNGGYGGGGGGAFRGGGGGGGGGYGGGGGGGYAGGGGGGGSADTGSPVTAISGEHTGNGSVIIEATSLCFLAGTQIRTPSGEIAIDALSVGDKILSYSGEARCIVWIGHSRVSAKPGQRDAATPILIFKGAIADNVPAKNLRVTKAHGLYIDEVLIPAEFLVNHHSIVWDDRSQDYTIYHIELETHDVLVADGAPAESYRDDGNRWRFENANSGWNLRPKKPCAPVLTGGLVVDSVWRRLLDRAGPRRKMPLTCMPDVHLMVDGHRVDATTRSAQQITFHLPRWRHSVRLVSRDAIPSELGVARDPRPLGVALRQLELRAGAEAVIVGANDRRLVDGFHSYEPVDQLRWTNGDARLPGSIFPIPRHDRATELTLHLTGATYYPLFQDEDCISGVSTPHQASGLHAS